MDRLVSVEAKEVEVQYRRSQRCTSSAALRVTNVMHTMSVAVQLSTTRPALYSFHPSPVALLPPLASASFELLLAPTPSPPLAAPPDHLHVRSAVLPTGRADASALLSLFSRPGVFVFRDAALPIVLTGPHVLEALLLSSFLSNDYSNKTKSTLETAFLLSRAAPACSPSDLAALLRRAAAGGNSRFVSALLSAGADACARGPDDDGRSTLALALASGSAEAVAALLNAGARLDPALDRTLMHEAASLNRTDLMRLLAEATPVSSGWAGAVDSCGRTPLHAAAEKGHVEAGRLCVSAWGTDTDCADERGWTPLHCAAAAGHLEMVELLLASSSYDAKRIVTRDERRMTPYDLAVEGGHPHLYDALRLGDALHRAARAGDLGGARACLMRGAEVGRADQNGWTPLHRAAFKGRIEVVRALIESGARLDAVDHAGYTPLRCAVEAGHADVALCLIARGAGRAGLKGVRGASRLPLKLDPCAIVASSLREDNKVIKA